MKLLSVTSLSVFSVLLFSIGFVPYLTQEVFAAEPEFNAFVADDPDDLDTILSNGDTLTITFSEATNATNNGAISRNEIIANFTDGTGAVDWGDAYSGVWNGDSTVLTVTLTDVTNAILTIGVTTVEGLAGSNIADADGGNSDTIDTTSNPRLLSGDFGLFVAVSGGGDGCNGDCEEPTLGLNERGMRL